MKKPIYSLVALVVLASSITITLNSSSESQTLLPEDCFVVNGVATCIAASDESENALFYNSPLPAEAPLKCLSKESLSPRYQAIFVPENDSTGDITPEIIASINKGIHVANAIMKNSSNNEREFRFATNEDCTPSIITHLIPKEIELEPNILVSYLNKNKGKILGNTEKVKTNFLVFIKSTKVFCGQGTGLPLLMKNGKWVQDTSPTQGNQINNGSQVALIGATCFEYPQVVAHELVHTLGAVSSISPNASAHGHCLDGHDLMCYSDAPNLNVTVNCPITQSIFTLDCNGDDYFSLNPAPGSYLSTHWNSANNIFLYNNNVKSELSNAPNSTLNSNKPTTLESVTKLNSPGTLNAKLSKNLLILNWSKSVNQGKFLYEVNIKSKHNSITKRYSSGVLSGKISVTRKTNDTLVISVKAISTSNASSSLTLKLLVP
jgi:hypothetical protein